MPKKAIVSGNKRARVEKRRKPIPAASPRDLLKKFRVLFSSIKAHYREMEKQCGSSGSQLWALAEIARVPGIRMSELAAAMLVHPSTASNLVERLVELGFVKKQRTDDDQRVVQLRITISGKSLLSRAPGPSVGLLLHALENMPAESIEMLSASMDELIAQLPLRDDSAASKPLADL